MQHCIFVDSVISEKNSADTVHYISCYIKGYTNVFNYASFLSKISPRKLPFEQIHVSIFVIYLPFLIWEWADNNSYHHLLYATIFGILSLLPLSRGIYIDGYAKPCRLNFLFDNLSTLVVQGHEGGNLQRHSKFSLYATQKQEFF